MSLDSLTSEEKAVLIRVLSTLRINEQHFRLRDRANAQLYIAPPKWSPITKETARAATALEDLLESLEPEPASEEVNPVNPDDPSL